MKPKELARRTGLKERTIRFYVEEGLLRPETRQQNSRTYRDYSQEDEARLRAIVTLRKSGFTLEEIRAMLEDPVGAEALYPAYLARLRATAREAAALLEAAEQVRPAGLDALSLAAQLEKSARDLSLPPADLAPHFRYLDEMEPRPEAPPFHRDARPVDIQAEDMLAFRSLGLKRQLDDTKESRLDPVPAGAAGAPAAPWWLGLLKFLATAAVVLFALDLLVGSGWLSHLRPGQLRLDLPGILLGLLVRLGLGRLQRLLFTKKP